MNAHNTGPRIGDIDTNLAASSAELSGLEISNDFPFSEIVGLEDAKLALILSTIEPAIGGVLLRGEKGSGKTTLARGLAGLLGPNTPFVDLPLGASEDRVVGTLALGAALTDNNIKFSPGLFAQANGGVLYVDEVNLLADHIVDTLLDVAVSGINRVEREGISHTHPAGFVLVGSMNPEEGELRPQLLDRFGLCVDVAASQEINERVEAVTRRLNFNSAPASTNAMTADHHLRQQLVQATPAALGPDVVKLCCELAIHFDVEGLRTDLVLAHAAAAFAGFDGRSTANITDVQRIASLVLTHRGRKDMFDSAYYPADQVDEVVGDFIEQQTLNEVETGEFPLVEVLPQQQPSDGQTERLDSGGVDDFYPEPIEQGVQSIDTDNQSDHDVADHYRNVSLDPNTEEAAKQETDRQDLTPEDTTQQESGDQLSDEPTTDLPSTSAGAAPTRSLRAPSMLDSLSTETPPLPPTSNLHEPNASPTTTTARSRTIRDQPLDPTTSNPIAVAATVRNVAARRSDDSEAKLATSDLRESVREVTKSKLLIFVVDTSGSMGAESRTEAAVGAIRSLLTNAYQSRSRVALITFQDTEAKIVLSPTSSVEVANLRLSNISTGGKTPLGAGIRMALSLAKDRRYTDWDRSIILLTDGRATGEPDAMEVSETAARAVYEAGIPTVVLDCENTFPRLGLAEGLAATMGASYIQLDDITSDAVTSSVRRAEKVLSS